MKPRRVVLPIATAMALLLALTGCTQAPVAPATPTTTIICATDAPSNAPCRQTWKLRWMVPLNTMVGIWVTQEHGFSQYVSPMVCPPGIGPNTPFDGFDGEWMKCTGSPEWRFDGRTLWMVNGADMTGVDARTGQVTEQVTDANRAAVIVAMPQPADDPAVSRPSELHFPSASSLGLVGDFAASGNMDFVLDGNWVFFAVGCVKGTDKDIPGARRSGGAPVINQTCGQPVLYAVNE